MPKKFLTLFLALILSGCKANLSGLSPEERAEKQLADLKSYKCTAELTRISNKAENTYTVRQYYSDGKYRLEMVAPETVAGNYSIFDGKTAAQFNPRVSGKIIKDVPLSQARDEIFLSWFAYNYFSANGKYIQGGVMETAIPGNYEYLSTERLWLDEETLLPKKLVIYDSQGNERYILDYLETELNAEIDEKIFEIPQ